jgi:hypothetical protein
MRKPCPSKRSNLLEDFKTNLGFTRFQNENHILFEGNNHQEECPSFKKRRFEGTYRLHHQDYFLRSVRRLLVTANVVLSLLILVTLMMEALCSSETSSKVFLMVARRRHSS